MRLLNGTGVSLIKKQKAARLTRAIAQPLAEVLEGRRMMDATVVVNSTLDTLFSAGSGNYSLRNAMTDAENDTTDETFTVTFDPTVFSTHKTITLSLGAFAIDFNNEGQIEHMVIQGPSAGVTIDAHQQSGVLNISTDDLGQLDLSNLTLDNASDDAIKLTDDTGPTLNLTNVTVENGSSNGAVVNSNDNSGTVDAASSTFENNSGSGIAAGEAVANNCTFDYNDWGVNLGTGGPQGYGSLVTATNSTFNGNTTGGLYADVINATDCTIANNEGVGIQYGSTVGFSGDGSLINNTIVGNDAGGVDTSALTNPITNVDDSNPNGPFVTLGNNLIAGNQSEQGEQVIGAINSSGHNLVGVATESNNLNGAGGWISTDLLGTSSSPINAQLGALADNGGPTMTMLPAASSPATNAGDNSLISGTSTDQRGLPRLVGTVDIGSVEVQPAVVGGSLTFTPPSSQTAAVNVSKTFSLGSFSESNATSPYTVVVNWGDGSSNTTFTQTTTGTLTAKPHTYAATGSDTVHVTVTDASGTTSNASFGVTVVTSSVSTSLALQSSSQTTQSNQSLTLTATVTPSTSGGINASGIVTFYLGGTALGSSAISGGVATLVTTSQLPIGTGTLTAQYSGDSHFSSTSTTTGVPLTVSAATTTTTLASSLSSASTAQTVTFTATVAPTTATSASLAGLGVSGTVTFYDGATVLGQETLINGLATYTTTSALPVGSDSITAQYGGDSVFTASIVATPAAVAVTATPTTTTLTSSVASKTVAQDLTLTATISPTLAASIAGLFVTGTVTFSEGSTVIGSVPATASGVETLTTTAVLPTGADSITAAYSGDSAFSTSTSAGVGITVTQHALVPVVTKRSIPASIIGGVAFKGSVSAKLTNGLTDTEAGPETGVYYVKLYASPTTTLDTTADPLVAQLHKTINLKQGKSTSVGLPVTSVPATMAGGTYYLLLQTTDSHGNTETVNTGSTVNIAAPVISLSAVFSALSKTAVTKGATVSVTNHGNVIDTGIFTAVIGLSTDAAGANVVASGAGMVKPAKLSLKAGKTGKISVSGWKTLLSTLASGDYYLTITLTDATGHTATAVSATTVS